MERSETFESIQGARIFVGGGQTAGFEKPESRLAITVRATDGRTGEPVEVQLWLTVPQFATIVWKFFSEVFTFGKENFFSKAMSRLMRRRYAVMTSPLARPGNGNEWFIPRYDNPKKIV